jgi:hypothetical protein
MRFPSDSFINNRSNANVFMFQDHLIVPGRQDFQSHFLSQSTLLEMYLLGTGV